MHTGPKMSVSSIGGNVIRTRENFVKQMQWKEYKKSNQLCHLSLGSIQVLRHQRGG